MLAETYQQCCESRGLAPRREVVTMEGRSLRLPGNTFDRFTDRVADADVEAIVEAVAASGSTFVDVHLPHNTITSVGGKCLARAIALSACLDSITSLDLSHNSIGADAGVALARSLRDNTTLMELRLACNPLGADAAGEAFGHALADALSVNTTLNRLDLYNTDLSMKALVPLVGSLATNTGLIKLILGKPLLPSPDDVSCVVQHLALALARNTHLQGIDLSYFGLYDEHLRHLFSALCASGIISLTLKANKLSQDAGKLLGRLLDRKEDFCSLVVSSNRIGDVGAVYLSEGLRVHPHLQTLAVENAAIGPKGIASLAEAIANCRALRSVSLWGNALQGDSAAELFAIQDRLNRLDHVDFGFQVVDGVPSVYKK